VAWVSYLGLPSHPSHAFASTTFRQNLFGGMLNFGVKGPAENGSKLVDSLRLASNLANVGDAKTLVIHPATTTHEQLSVDEQATTGVTPDLIRVSACCCYLDIGYVLIIVFTLGFGWHREYQRYHCRFRGGFQSHLSLIPGLFW
jgi:Cys/Met metabolism PLP-dependent enzyme